jgi:actin-like ATPase involved in cell morphogenesis
MSDVNTFIDAIGQDVNEAVVPRVQDLAEQIRAKTFAEYGPRVSTFASELVKDIIDEQSETIRQFATTVIQDLFQRYQPELAGEVHTNFVNGCVQLTGHGIRLDLKRRDTGAAVASLDIPVSLQIKVGELGVKLQNTPIRFDVVR